MKLSELEAYEVIKEQELGDIASHGTYLIHKKTGAKVCAIENHDENKVFYIGFRTPVSDSTGVTHIIEHTVLCGSEKYPLKDPFLELAKGSLNTFLNAMTYPDKTVYPVASCNEKDYDNLMDVYLDAVFNPNISKYEEIFKQEGWHYELDSVDGELTINGVVYNEMKGVYSNPDSLNDRFVTTGLYPDTGYAFESGGDPKCIPDLKYEDYLNYYNSHYHPSNSYIYFYGDLDIAKRLDYIDREYLSKYDRIDPGSEVKRQESFDAPREMIEHYGISEEDEEEKSTYISYNTALDSDTELLIALDTLFQVMVGMAGTPVKQALLDAGVGSEVTGGVDDSLLQPVFQIMVKGADETDKEKFLEIVKRELKKASEEGINKKAIIANLNSKEFDYREADFGSAPKGLIYGLNILSTWLYDDDRVFDELDIGKYFPDLKKKAEEGYFEGLINKYILDNPHALTLVIAPGKGLNTKMSNDLAGKLSEYKSRLSEEDRRALVEETRSLHEYQETPDTPEDLLCLPILERDDLEKKIRPLSNIPVEDRGINVVYHDFETNGIVYVEMQFDMEDITEEELFTFVLAKKFMSGCSTKQHTFSELSIEKNIGWGLGIGDWGLGGIDFGVTGSELKNGGIQIKAFVRFKVLPDNLVPGAELVKEMMTEYDFSDKDRMRQLISRTVTGKKTDMSAAGHQTAILRARSYFSQLSRFNEIMEGLENYDFLSELLDSFDEKIDGYVERACKLIKKIYNSKNMCVSLTCDEALKKQALDAIHIIADALPDVGREIKNTELPLAAKNEGLTDAGNVMYVARAGNFKTAGFAYTGTLAVLRTILSYDYLWGQVRVLGGAYGCMCGFMRSGDSYFVSYRDPNLTRTNDVFEKAADFVASYDADDRDVLKAVIGTLSSIDVPLSPDMKGARSFAAYRAGYTEEDLQKERDEILSVTAEDIRKLAPLIKAVIDAGFICVVGNENVLKENSGLFGEIRPLVK
mgnify:CR=1 FL=1